MVKYSEVFGLSLFVEENCRPDILLNGEAMLETLSLHPKKVRSKLLVFMTCSIVCFLDVLNIIKFVFQPFELKEFSSLLEGCVAFNMVLIRLATLYYFRNTFLELFEAQKQYWRIDDFSDVVKNENIKLMKLGFMFSKLLLNFCYISLVTMGLNAFYNKLPLNVYIPNIYGFNFVSLFMLDVIFTCIAIIVDVGFDLVFAGFCMHVVIQLRLIKATLQNIEFDEMNEIYNENDCLSLLKRCVAHKVHINEVVNKMRGVFSAVTLFQSSFSVFAICVELYLSSELMFTDIAAAFKAIAFGFAFTNQIAIYCLTGSEITITAKEISDAIYNSNWYKGNVKFRIYSILLMEESQREMALSVGGLYKLQRQTLTYIFRMSYTFLTMLRAQKAIGH